AAAARAVAHHAALLIVVPGARRGPGRGARAPALEHAGGRSRVGGLLGPRLCAHVVALALALGAPWPARAAPAAARGRGAARALARGLRAALPARALGAGAGLGRGLARGGGGDAGAPRQGLPRLSGREHAARAPQHGGHAARRAGLEPAAAGRAL